MYLYLTQNSLFQFKLIFTDYDTSLISQNNIQYYIDILK